MTPKKKKLKKKQWIGLVFIAPWLIGLIGLQVYPFVASLFYSFTEYNIMSSPKWIGLANYVKLFTADNEFWYSVKVTLIYTIFTVPGKLTVALIVALVMNKNMKGINFIRTIYYIPSLIGGSIGIAILWKLMFQEEGIINSLLKAIHLPTLHWLGDPKTALPTIILLQLWTFGSSFVMFLAALKMYRRICMKQRISMEPAAGRNSLRLHCHRFPLLYFSILSCRRSQHYKALPAHWSLPTEAR